MARTTSSTKGRHIRQPDHTLPKGAACFACKTRRVKCDGLEPICTSCIRFARYQGLDVAECVCVWSEKRRSRTTRTVRVNRKPFEGDREPRASRDRSPERSTNTPEGESSWASHAPSDSGSSSPSTPPASHHFDPISSFAFPLPPTRDAAIDFDLSLLAVPNAPSLSLYHPLHNPNPIGGMPLPPHPHQAPANHFHNLTFAAAPPPLALDPNAPFLLPVPTGTNRAPAYWKFNLNGLEVAKAPDGLPVSTFLLPQPSAGLETCPFWSLP